MKAAVFLALVAVFAPLAASAKPKPEAAAAPAPPAPPTEADWITPDPQNILVIDTSKGRIIVEMSPTAAPNHVARVRALARAGVYDGRTFFRVIDNFMDQTGDPLDSGLGQSSMPNLAPEFTFKRGPDTPFALVTTADGAEEGYVEGLPVISQPLSLGMLTVDHKVQAYGTYCTGIAGMARADDPGSANSQFYLMRTDASTPDHGTHSLDQKYTAWGRVIAGQDVVDAIKTGEPVEAPADKMLSAKILADMPEATRPKVRVIDTNGAWFKAAVARAAAAQDVGFTVCDVVPPAEVK